MGEKVADGFVAEEKLPLPPETIDQLPFPTVGVDPAKVAEVAPHNV